MKKFLYIFILLFIVGWAQAQQRVVYTINDGWKFTKGSPFEAQLAGCDDSSWETVNIPHTWNNKDADDETPGFYRGPAWYRKQLFVDKSQEGRQAVIYFEGANQEVRFYLNGQFVGEHKGGYTRFCFDITSHLRYGQENLFAIYVNNVYNPNIPPLSADFTFFGGIYRDVYLQFMNPVHIATNDYASSGVYIRTPEVNNSAASVEITTLLTNNTLQPAEIRVENVICDADGKEVKKTHAEIKLASGETKTDISKKIKIDSPRLWDIDDPYRYMVYTRILDKKKGTLLDEVVNPLGLRWFKFDSEKGFFLNGKGRKLIGTARHQDYFQKGNALRDELHVQDVLLLKEMGGNFLRVSHYPQDPVIMEMCDKLGIVTSVEISVVNAVTETEEFLQNSVEMAKKYGVQLVVRSSLNNNEGTIVREEVNMEKMLVSGVAADKNATRIAVIGLKDEPGIAFHLFNALAKYNINVDIILQSVGRNGTKDISFTVAEDEADEAVAIIQKSFPKSEYNKIDEEKDVAKISIVGAGMMTHPGVAASMFEALYDAGVNIKMISTSEIRVTVLIDEKYTERALNAVHDKFALGD